MTRRILLHLLTAASSLPACSPFLTQWLEAAVPEHHTNGIAPPEPSYWRDYKPKFFTQTDFEALEAMTEMLIPTDETPGARDAHCAHFIDFLLSATGDYAPQTQKQWLAAMAQLNELGFQGGDSKVRSSIVEQISLPERDRSKKHPASAAYLLIKRENAFAFYTSRAGIIGALDYKGNTYNAVFPGCQHPEHHAL